MAPAADDASRYAEDPGGLFGGEEPVGRVSSHGQIVPALSLVVSLLVAIGDAAGGVVDAAAGGVMGCGVEARTGAGGRWAGGRRGLVVVPHGPPGEDLADVEDTGSAGVRVVPQHAVAVEHLVDDAALGHPGDEDDLARRPSVVLDEVRDGVQRDVEVPRRFGSPARIV